MSAYGHKTILLQRTGPSLSIQALLASAFAVVFAVAFTPAFAVTIAFTVAFAFAFTIALDFACPTLLRPVLFHYGPSQLVNESPTKAILQPAT